MAHRSFGVLCAVLVSAQLSQAQELAPVTVRGVAWDSLRAAPLSRAFIGIAGTARSATSDARGRFRFDSVVPGTYTFTMQHDVLDSVGFTGRSARVAIDATHNTVSIAVPSFATLWRAACGGGAPPKDTGFVYGTVRDAADHPAANALVGVSWLDVSYRKKVGFEQQNWGGEVRTDSTGRYTLCGVPANVGLQLRAASDSEVSGTVELTPRTLRVARRDFRLAPAAAASSVARGTIVGTLTGEGGRPVAGAIIATEGLPEVRSDDDGRFVIRDVPAGTRQIDVRAIGASPMTAIVDVVARDSTPVALEMRRVQTLAEIRVTAPTFRQVMLRDINERRRTALGYFRDSTTIAKMPSAIASLDGIAGLKVCRPPAGGGSARFIDSIEDCRRPKCERAIWIDRVRLDAIALVLLNPADIATVEVYNRQTFTPIEFQAREREILLCGAVVVWTKRFLRS
jgi:protocatechuate 3,4-dioxygenase beta subunit